MRIARVLELISAAAVLAALCIVAGYWSALPNRVPRHFNSAGNPDAYGSRAGVLVPALVALGLYLSFTQIQRTPAKFYNYPVRISEENAAAQYALARELLTALKATLCSHLAVASWLTVQVALGHRQGLGVWFLPALLAAVLLPLLWYAQRLKRTLSA